MTEDVVERTWKHFMGYRSMARVMRPNLTNVHLPMTRQQLLDNIQKNDGASLADAEGQVAAFERSFNADRD